jgi:hypothetical protein
MMAHDVRVLWPQGCGWSDKEHSHDGVTIPRMHRRGLDAGLIVQQVRGQIAERGLGDRNRGVGERGARLATGISMETRGCHEQGAHRSRHNEFWRNTSPPRQCIGPFQARRIERLCYGWKTIVSSSTL